MFRTVTALLLLTLASFTQKSNQHPRDSEIKDPDTLSWWHYTEALSNDSMEGRDVGSAGYDRAAKLVADRFKASGLQPAGDNGTYFQEMPMFETQVMSEGTSFVLLRQGAGTAGSKGEDKKEIEQPYKFLHQITIRASEDLPAQFEGELVFAGYCAKGTLPTDSAKLDIKDKIVL